MGKIVYQLAVLFSFLYLAAFVHQCHGRVSWAAFPQEKPVSWAAFPQEKPAWGECLNNNMSIIPQTGSKDNDKIHMLAGQPTEADFNHYAGYVTVDAEAGRALYYYLAESPKDPSTKPLVLWINGGPGCSSIGYGVFEEIGPFRVNKDGKTLYINDFAWNKEANILFLDSPAGTGFSYSNRTSDYELSGDSRATHDAYIFLLNWLERFPKYKSRDFFINGESYAGHYVPPLAQAILLNNNCGNHAEIKLKAVAIVNGLIDYETYQLGRVDYLWSHALISDELRSGIQLNCNFSSKAKVSDTCNYHLNMTLNATGNILPDEIYAPLCNSSLQSAPDTGYDPCTDNYVTAYLNTPEMQAALHANVSKNIPYPWVLCSSKIGTLWKDSPPSMLPIIQDLMNNGVSVWLYSGDVDSLIPVTSTRYAINKLKPSVNTPWYAWYTGGEVGGYAVGYDNLTFVTVRGAGHEVPSYQPARAFAVFSSFIMGKLPPSK